MAVMDYVRSRLGGAFPASYAAIDTETTGLAFDKDLVVEFGYCLVLNGQVADRLSLVIDWTDHSVVPNHWLEARLDYVRSSMEAQGKPYHHSIVRMKADGLKPDRALRFIKAYLAAVHQRKIPFVAHNGLFDEAMIAGNLAGFKVDPQGFSFGDDGWIDTALIEKALSGRHGRLVPRPSETLRSFYQRVKATRITGLKYNLDHCFEKYGLDKLGVEAQDMHGAEADAFCSHLLAQTFFARTIGPASPAIAVAGPAFRRVGQRNY